MNAGGPRWLAADVSCAPEDVDEFCAWLYEAGSSGAEVRARSVLAYFEAPPWSPAAVVRLLRKFRPRLRLKMGDPVVRQLRRGDWQENWRRFFTPIRISQRIRIIPDWMSPAGYREELVLRIRPGQGFGTGHHPSTKIYLRLIEAVLRRGDRFLDVGCGSGVGAVAALLLGASSCTAVEVDPDAVAETRHNLRLNGLAGAARLLQRDMRRCRPRRADVVGANLLLSEMEQCWEQLVRAVRPGGVLVLSGLLTTQRARVTRRLKTLGFISIRNRRSGEWSGLAAKRR